MNKNSKILIACEESSTVTTAFRELGFNNTFSCDINPCSGKYPEWHIQDDVFNIINNAWDMMIAFPPCTYLTVTGNKWFKPEYKDKYPNREKDRQDAIEFFLKLWNADIPKIAIENPVGVMSSVLRKPDQIIHPYHFGEPHAKRTCLWLKGLPKLVHTKIVEPQYYTYANGKRDSTWHMETMKLPPKERAKVRSKTFQSVAEQMAKQWG